MTNPERNESELTFSRRLEELDKSLQDIRLKHEEELKQIKTANAKFLSNLTKTQQETLNKLDLDMAEKVYNYQVSLADKYSKKYANQKISDAQIEKKIAMDIQKFIYVEKQKMANREHEEALDRIKEEYNVKLKTNERERKNKSKSLIQSYKEEKALQKEMAEEMRAQGASELDIMKETKQLSIEGVKEAIFSKDTLSTVVNSLVNGLRQKFDGTIQTYGQYQQKINTRLQGSGKSWNGYLGIGGIEDKIKSSVGSNPYVKLQSVMDNVVKATEAGIANNIEQRAFLQTISESIADTFEAFDANLLRVIRLQQEDSTAARLGLEADLTNFFNNYFGDTAYLNNSFDIVSQNLIETTSQLNAKEAVEVEYMIQKWLGSLYSVGFSDTAIGKISQALGYLGSGNVSGLASDAEMQNLIVMAASRANMSYSDLLIDGLDSSNTNKLLRSMVDYLGEIANSDNKIVKSEYAKVFGMSVSDLTAIKNLESDLTSITKSSMSYRGSINELYDQMNQLTSRISIAGMLQNMFDNVNYSIGTGIAGNPATYALWQVTSMIEDLTGGINLPTVGTLGNFVDLNTTVTNLMRSGIVGAGTLGAIGSIISGVSSTFMPTSILAKLGISPDGSSLTSDYKRRGTGLNRNRKQIKQISGSNLIGNTSGEDYYNQTLTNANEEVDKKAKQKEQDNTDITLNNIHEYLLSVFDPKITEIEKLVALMAGYSTRETSWNTFKNDDGKMYTGTKVQVSYPPDFNPENTKKTSDLLASISSSTSDILTLLNDVVTGTKSLTIRNSLIDLP